MSSLFDSLGLGDISGWLKPVLGAGIGAYNTINKSNAADDYANLLHDSEQQNYDQQKAAYEAQQAYQLAAFGANQSAKNAASASASAAARTNQASALKAQKKGLKTEKQYFSNAQGLLSPYADAGKQILPQQTETYGKSLSGINQLLASLLTPASIGKMNQSTSAYSIPVALPSYLRGA